MKNKSKTNSAIQLVFLIIVLVPVIASVFAQEINNLKIQSPAFNNNEMIPRKYTCDGSDISPLLVWGGVPKNTKSLAVICDDPDAPGKVWVHWVVYNLSPEIKTLEGGISMSANVLLQGINDFKKIGYCGPCPPSGIHRYFFKLYALDIKVPLSAGATKDQLLAIMKEHILAEAQLIGKYKR